MTTTRRATTVARYPWGMVLDRERLPRFIAARIIGRWTVRFTVLPGRGVEFSRTGCRSPGGMFSRKKDSLTLLELTEGETAAIHALHNDGVTKIHLDSDVR